MSSEEAWLLQLILPIQQSTQQLVQVILMLTPFVYCVVGHSGIFLELSLTKALLRVSHN